MGVGDGPAGPCWLRGLITVRGVGSSLDTVDSESCRFGLGRDASAALVGVLAGMGEKLPRTLGVGRAGCMEAMSSW